MDLTKKQMEEISKLLNSEKEENTKMDFSKKVVVSVIGFFVAYCLATLFVFLKTGTEPTILTGAVASFCAVELGSLAGIKIKGNNPILNTIEQGTVEFDEANEEGDII